MFAQLIRALIYLAVLALAFWLIVWVFGLLGFALPAMVVKILGVIFVLIAILILYQVLWPAISANWP